MSNTIRIKKRAASGSAGAPSSLSPSELAFNEADLKLYYGFGDNGSTPPSASSIIVIGGSGGFFNKTDTRTANTILAGPTSGSAAAPTFRSLVVADIPTLTSAKVSDFDTQVRTNRVDQLASATNPVTGVTPTSDNHFATKSYVDGVSQGLDVKDSCVAATTGNITIATALNNGDTLDGVSLSTNDRVLVKDQSSASENGIYIVGSSPARADDLAAGADAAGMFTFVEKGTVNADNGFVCSSDKGSAVVGTNNLTFVQFSGAGQITAGDGLDKSANTLSVDLKSNGGLVIESTEIAVDLSASSITGTLAVSDGGTGSTSASAARTALGLAIGTNVQAFDAQLSDVAGLTPSNGVFIVGDGSNFVAESGATARASLGLTIGTNVQAYDADLDNLSGCQSGASAALAALTSTEVAILDGATVTTTELNTVCDGGTSATSTTLATAARFVCNDTGTMQQVALSDLVTFLEDGATSGFDINGGTY